MDGSDAIVTILTAASSGTYIKTVTIKTISKVINQGMVRLFIYNGTTSFLLMEIDTPIASNSGTFACYSKTINLNYFLKAGDILKASTEETKTFNVIAEGFDLSYP